MNIKSLASKIVLTITIAAAVAISGLTAKADQGVTISKRTLGDVVPLLPVTLSTNGCGDNAGTASTNALTSTFVDVPPGCIACLSGQIVSGGAGVSNCVFVVNGSAGNSVANTSSLISPTVANVSAGTNNFILTVYTNSPARALTITSFGSTQTNHVTINNLNWFFIPSF